MNIPFVDLKAQYQSIKTEIDAAIQNVIDESAFIKGKYVQQFEAEYAKITEELRFTEKVLYTRYKAGKKDSLKSVARRFGTSTKMLAELNSLNTKGRITGKTLVVPVKQTVDFSQEGRATRNTGSKDIYAKYYTVKKGDTLDSLARRFKTSTKLLTAWNKLKLKVALKPGRRIIIAKFIKKNGEMVPAAMG